MAKKKDTHFLDMIRKFSETGRLDKDGLCRCVDMSGVEHIFFSLIPTCDDIQELSREGLSSKYWASGCYINDSNRFRVFTPLRETILCFCAVLNGELD